MSNHFTGPDGTEYSLDHLQTQKYEFKLKIGDQLFDVPAILTFSNHCYSDDRNAAGASAQQADEWYCLSDGKGPRVFCVKRWKSSLSLPDYLRTTIQKGLDCYKTNGGGNFIRIHDNDVNQKYAGWYVFFGFSAAKDSGPGVVRINVTSHHHRRKLPDSVRSTTKFKFGSLLAQWFKDRPAILKKLKSSSPLSISPVGGAVEVVSEVRDAGPVAADASSYEKAA